MGTLRVAASYKGKGIGNGNWELEVRRWMGGVDFVRISRADDIRPYIFRFERSELTPQSRR